MHMMRPMTARLTSAIAAALCAATTVNAQQRDPYPATLHFGTGMINIPVAWVSPRSYDTWIQTSAKTIPWAEGTGKEQGLASSINTNISMDVHFLSRFSLGVSAYSQNPEYGVFGQALLLRDRPGTYLPGVAVGFRNLGPYECEDRLLVGHDIVLNPETNEYEEVCARPGLKTNGTFFGVATKEVSFGASSGTVPTSSMGFTVGFGNGLFSDDGDYGVIYNEKGTIASGLFLGGRFSTHPTTNITLHFMAENDGWDYNAGMVADYRGITLGVYGTELEEGTKRDLTRRWGNEFNYTKFNVSLGYSGNIIDIARGVILRTRITELTREQDRLRLEVRTRERRIAALEATLRRAQAGELADIDKRRQQIDRDLESERDAIRKANERLQELERSRPPATPPPAPSLSR